MAEDTWRFNLFAFYGNLNSQLYIDDFEAPGFYDYRTNTAMVSLGFDRKLVNNLYGGMSYTFAHSESLVEQDMGETDNTTHGIQFKITSDTRDNVYYARAGRKANFRWQTYQKWLGNVETANKITVAYNQYFSVRDDTDVVAARVYGVFGLGDITFEQQVVIGRQDIRGYSEAKYRGDGKVAIQGEYRWNFNDKMGLVGFAGLATIYGSDTTEFNGNFIQALAQDTVTGLLKRANLILDWMVLLAKMIGEFTLGLEKPFNFFLFNEIKMT